MEAEAETGLKKARDIISLVMESVEGCENPNCEPGISDYRYPKGHPDIREYPEFEGKTALELLEHKILVLIEGRA